jgi:hypothetical protein
VNGDNIRTLPVYHPDKEPPGFWLKLNSIEPEKLVDSARIHMQLEGIAAGTRVWNELDSPSFRSSDLALIAMARSRSVLGESFDPSFPALQNRLVQSRLSSGMKLLLLPKRTRGSTVFVALRLGYGNVESLRGWSTAASLVPGMLLRGTTRHNRAELQDELARLETVVETGSFGAGVAGHDRDNARASL